MCFMEMPPSWVFTGILSTGAAQVKQRRRKNKKKACPNPYAGTWSMPFSAKALVVDADHHGGGLDDRIGLLANGQAQLLHSSHGNGGADHVAAADVDLHDGVHRALVDLGDGTLQLITRTQFYSTKSSFLLSRTMRLLRPFSKWRYNIAHLAGKCTLFLQHLL